MTIEKNNSWEKIYSSYEDAKEKNEQRLFYLGEGKYFHRDHDWGTHCPSDSFLGLIGYLRKYGNEQMLSSFRNDFSNLFMQDLTIDEFNTLLTYIWIYLVDFYERENSEIILEWRIEKELRILIENKFNSFPKISPTEKYEQLSDEWIYQNVESSFKRIKNRTGINILDITGKSDIEYKNLKK